MLGGTATFDFQLLKMESFADLVKITDTNVDKIYRSCVDWRHGNDFRKTNVNGMR